ncbi:MAG: molybdopterin-synthase adenylyltransferase MoeB [Rhodothermales bacterium]|nr:molybdopterin-synthase adenylyltransferase MoeB [Rhodothermales bacterium]MBO6778710.1 molybdopterin-synthase adenylyltransferase MoeB [Rhodothermales bacterium]
MLTPQERNRYARHLLLPGVGVEGQEKLKAASVLIVGAGGLGSPLALYLAAAGVGRLGIVDFDTVDATNLQRQILHGTSDIGRSKLDSAEDRLREINPHVEIVRFDTRLHAGNALEVLQGFDVVADGTDNFPTRYLVNDACVLLGIPNVHASVFRFEGQVSVFGMPDGPCYRCVYPVPPPPELMPSCAEGGVLGVLPGTVGTLQATEVLKLLLGIGEALVGQLLIFDALTMDVQLLGVPRSADCPVCGPSPSITVLVDYEAFCGVQADPPQVPGISARELAASREEYLLLDVRQPEERDIASLGGVLIPLAELAARVHEIPGGRGIVVYCRTGVRSARAVALLADRGVEGVLNLEGGIRAWSREVDPTIPEY